MREAKMPPTEEFSNVLHLISDILDRLIDAQASNAEAMSSLKKAVEVMEREINELNRHFSNGFKSELKAHTKEMFAEHRDKQDDKYGGKELFTTIKSIHSNVEEIKTVQHSWWYWIKHVGLVVAGFGACVAAVVKAIQWLSTTI